MRISKFGYLVLLGLSASAQSLHADTVEYSTSGYFGAIPGTTSVTAGSESLSYTGLSNIFVDTPSIVSFGEFFPAFGPAGSAGSFTGDTFTLVISETDNAVSVSRSITGVLSGRLTVSAAGSPSSNVFVNFTNQFANFTEANGNIATYTPFSTPVSTEMTTIQGNVDSNPPPVTPLPKSAFGAAGLLGLVGLRQLARRFLAI